MTSMPPRVARVVAEEAFGEQLRSWIAKSTLTFSRAAEGLGLRRDDLYDVMDGRAHARAAWLQLVPEVERLWLEARAAAHGLELCDATREERSCSLAEIVDALSSTMVCAASGEADGVVTRDEAQAEMEQWRRVAFMMRLRRARLRALGAR